MSHKPIHNGLFQIERPKPASLLPLHALENGDLVAVEMPSGHACLPGPSLCDTVREALRMTLPKNPAFLCLSFGEEALANPSLPGRLSALAASAGSEPSGLCLFFGDQDCLKHGMRALDSLLGLKRAGFRVGLNIQLLEALPGLFVEKLPVDVLRLDPLDAMPLPGDREAHDRLADFTRYAANLLMTPAARGVRSAEQLGILRDAGIRIGQGPLFAAGDLSVPRHVLCNP